MKITLYSNNCPKCRVLKEKLEVLEIEYEEKNDADFLEKNGIFSFPAMKVGGKIYKFYDAIKWLKNRRNLTRANVSTSHQAIR